MALPHIGSWGTPDFGLTEWVQKTFLPQAPTTAQGGSSLGVSTGVQPFQAQKFVSPTAEQIKNTYSPGPGGGLSGGGGSSVGGGQVLSASTQNTGQSGGNNGVMDWAAEQARIDLQNAMGEFDRQAAEAEAQKAEAGQTLQNTLTGYETQRGRAKTEGESQLLSAEQSRQRETATATKTAKDVQGKNRNILRAMGILSSSAAGEMLGKPFEALQGVTANIGEVFTKRKQEVENWMAQRNQDIDMAVNQVQQNYTNLVNQINRDIRYTGEQRASAVREAANALRGTMIQLQGQAQANQQAAAQYQAQLLSQVAQLQLYQNPKADVSGIMSQLIGLTGNASPSQSSQVLSDVEARKRLGLA